MDFEFVKISGDYVCIDYDDYTPNVFSLCLIKEMNDKKYDYNFYLIRHKNQLCKYSFQSGLSRFSEDSVEIIKNKLNELLHDCFVKYEKVKMSKDNDFTKVEKTINFLESLLDTEDDVMFKKIGDFIKYLEE